MTLRRKFPQSAIELLLAAAYQAIQQGMKAGRVVVMHRVAKFVQDDKIAQMFGQLHQKKAERKGVLRGAAPPLRACGTDRKLRVTQPRLMRQALHAGWKVLLGQAAQSLDLGALLLLRALRIGTFTRLDTRHGALHPATLLLQEGQGPLTRHKARIGQPHLPRRAHRQRDATCSGRTDKGGFAVAHNSKFRI